jgi:RNA polymerase sigma-70 factor (ECF subfamily)
MVPYREETLRSVQGPTDAELNVREHLEELAWRLPPKPFVILLFMDVFDFTARETAAWLGGTEVAVQVALSRARARLQRMKRSGREKGPAAGSKREVIAAAGNAFECAAFFEAVLEAFRCRQPSAIQEAYFSLIASGARLQGIRALGGKVYFTFQDPDGNVIMVVST